MRNKSDLQLLSSRGCHIPGELHFPRSQHDLQEVMVNLMQSLRILIAFIPRVKTKHKTQDLSCFLYLEPSLSILLKNLLKIGHSLSKREYNTTGLCITIEAVSTILTKLVINTLKIFMEYNADCAVSILALVIPILII